MRSGVQFSLSLQKKPFRRSLEGFFRFDRQKLAFVRAERKKDLMSAASKGFVCKAPPDESRGRQAE